MKLTSSIAATRNFRSKCHRNVILSLVTLTSLVFVTSVSIASLADDEQVSVTGASAAASPQNDGVYRKYAVATDAAQCSDIGRCVLHIVTAGVRK